MSLAIAQKLSPNNTRKQKRDIVHGALKCSQTIYHTFPVSVIQRKPNCPCGGGCPHCKNNLTIQPKLKIDEPGDKYEQEADRVAEQVMRMPDLSKAQGKGVSKDNKFPSVQRMCTECEEEEVHRQKNNLELGYLELGYSSEEKLHGQTNGIKIQRMCTECEEELHRQPVKEDEELLQTKGVSGNTPEVTPSVESQINSIRSGGHPLSESVRAFFEPRFGQDFSQVRIHTDSSSEESVKAVNAKAYTVGIDIVFGSGQYAPGTESGDKLIAHELTHVIQQERGLPYGNLIQRKDTSPKIPNYRDCTESTTLGSTTANKELESARDRASDYVDVAISQLAQDPARYRKDASYRIALGRHFINPSATDRQNIRANYLKIRNQLKPKKIRCAASKEDREFCETRTKDKESAAFMTDGETFLCESFWTMNHKCRAIVLIHEAAHAVGIGLGSPHPPYRGSTEYPFGARSPGVGQSTSLRMNNPDAYSFFAAHIWREIDTECFAAIVIRITGRAVDTKPLFEQAEGCAKQKGLSPFCVSIIRKALDHGWRREQK